MRSLFSTLGITGLESELNYLETYPGQRGLRQFFESVMSLEGERKNHVTAGAVTNALPQVEKNPVFRWIVDLNDAYPGDIGILAPLMLNLICLKPRQAMFLGAG